MRRAVEWLAVPGLGRTTVYGVNIGNSSATPSDAVNSILYPEAPTVSQTQTGQPRSAPPLPLNGQRRELCNAQYCIHVYSVAVESLASSPLSASVAWIWLGRIEPESKRMKSRGEHVKATPPQCLVDASSHHADDDPQSLDIRRGSVSEGDNQSGTSLLVFPILLVLLEEDLLSKCGATRGTTDP